jgi:hypothetical protein
MLKSSLFLHFLLFLSCFLFAQGLEWGQHPYVIRGEVYVDLEPIYAGHVDEDYPLDINMASRRALEEAALFYSAMIYGWSFNYEVGERARQIDEILELELLGSIQFGDPAMRVTDTEIRDMRLRLWTDYHLSDALQRRMQVWRTGTTRNTQAVGYGPSSIDEYPGWLVLKKMALEDAARVALRTMLRGSERNRPKEVRGFISLASFPRYFIDSGRWAVSARFRVQITEIIPFAAY